MKPLNSQPNSPLACQYSSAQLDCTNLYFWHKSYMYFIKNQCYNETKTLMIIIIANMQTKVQLVPCKNPHLQQPVANVICASPQTSKNFQALSHRCFYCRLCLFSIFLNWALCCRVFICFCSFFIVSNSLFCIV